MIQQLSMLIRFVMKTKQLINCYDLSVQFGKLQQHMNRVECRKHHDAVSSICMGKGCKNRLMCPLCTDEEQHKYHSNFISFNLWQMIRSRKSQYKNRNTLRLEQLVNFLNKKFMIEISRLQSSIQQKLQVRLRTDFIKTKDPAIISYISQIENNDYTDLDEVKIDQVRKALQEAAPELNSDEEQELLLSRKNLQRIQKILSKAFEEIRIIEKIYWLQQDGESQAQTRKKSKSDVWGLFKSLKLNQQSSIDKFRQQENQSKEALHKSLNINQSKKELSYQKRNSGLTGSNLYNLLRSNQVDWKQITSLNLSENGITLLDAFIQMPTLALKRIDLSKNLINTIQPLTVLKLPELQVLLLNSNKIYSIQPFKRAEWPKLKLLDLSENQITQIQGIMQWKFPFLETLILSLNKIRSFKPFTVVDWPHIIKIQIKGIKLEPNEQIEKLVFHDRTLMKKFWRIF